MSESLLHEMVCQYLRVQYPNVLFHTDFGAGLKMTMGQAVRQKKLQCTRAWPDLFIAQKLYIGSGTNLQVYAGLFLELKKEGTKLYLKDGTTMVADPHVREQAEVLEKLRERGYKAEFAVGFDAVKRIIDNYLA